jgi:hypothetical protein
MKRNSLRVAGLLGTLTVAFVIPSVAARASVPTTTPPRIVATPNNVMVNTQIALTGSGFQPRTRLRLAECSMTTWVIVAQHPCDSTNRISVRTDLHGRFTTPFMVQLCARSTTGSDPITEETCYVGAREVQGLDTVTLVGAAQITVTYP